ncbi:cardiac-enriched FHL2-interacting protein [Neoarius graeffei]|uniref:cardiac-enriched FHL2-interacting protein n=1 Tax=Neoarius graeffei TaxID=443677 RepID=UPI00298D20DD|nr:cardiac-enriched FHL2-interacting protein [Neoarius graeffei]
MYEGQSCRTKGWSGERVIQEEHTLGKGVGNIAEGSYRGEQVELSFSTRNRKGPANHSPAPSSRAPKSGIPPRYFESPLPTRRQQSLLRAQNLQKESKIGAKKVRSTSQSLQSGARRLSSECTSETSSMGSEFDDADSEVKWFTDQAFRSLSSPQVDYLDVYSSSCGSSINVSQPSTMDSPGSATWISYTDLHDMLQENDDVLCRTSSFLPHGTLDPAKHFEMGSFECVDVAVESKEETSSGKRTVPKRRIQFKRHNFDEQESPENEGKAMDSLSTQTCSRDTFVCQHSTPASMQEDLVQGEHEIQAGKKMLQKSTYLDESSPKSKMASSIIKNVLSKKMDTATKEYSRSEPCENKNKHIETLSGGDSSNAEGQNSSLPSEYSLSFEDFGGKEERSTYPQKRSCRPKVPPKPVFKANCLPPNSNSAGVAIQCKTLVKDQIRPIMVGAFESKTSKKQIFGNSEKEASKVREEHSSDSGSTINRSPNCTAICVASTQRRMTNSDSKYPMTPETHKQQEGSSSMFLSKTPGITLKPCTIKDKNKSSLKASLYPELEISKDTRCESLLGLEETPEERTRLKTGVEADTGEDNEKNKAKSVIHKVRDVRKLVKNTYNLSFKASNTTLHVKDVVPEKQKGMQPENPHPLQIECKAISCKGKSASCNKSTTQQDIAHTTDKSKMPQMDSPKRNDEDITKITAKASLPNIQHSDVDLFVGLDKRNSISPSGNCEQSKKLEMPSRPSSKEISTLVFLQDSTPKSVQKPTSPASPEVKTANSSHSVSMLRKEKGMQADIGVCDVLSEGVGAKPKHINRLEVPLQTYASEGTSSESQKVKKEDADLPPEQNISLNSGLQTREGNLQVRSSPKLKEVRVLPSGKEGDNQSQGDLLQPPKEQEIAVAASSKAEVRAFSSNTKIHGMPVTSSKEIELPIQVRSISSDRPKPSVLPKPCYKQPFAEIRSTSTDFPKTDTTPTAPILKEQTHLKSDVKIIETSATVIHNEQSTNTASSNTKILAVSAVSSHKPQTIPTTSSSAQKSTATTSRQEVSITSVQNSSNQQKQNIQEQVTAATSYASNYQTLPIVSQANTYMQPTVTASSNNQLQTDNFHFPTSDDPPSYDERESFSPLHLSDLPPRRKNRYHPTTKHSLCSCTSCSHPQFGQPYHGSQNQTPPAPHSPGQVISCPGVPPQAQVRPHQCRPDGQASNYPSVSPKTTVQQAPAMIQPIHHSHTCPAPAIQPYGNEQQQPSIQHMDRHSGNQRSPQVPSGATYREHSRSPNIAPLDPRSQFFNPQELPPAFGHEYGNDGPGGGGVLYPENTSGLGYGQSPRRVLLDPETGKYFYIEVPMQPVRKMLFDPEIGQYVEVLIPQQAMPNSSVYPPTAAPYQGPYHGQGLYASQYLPYAMPPHPQPAQQPRHPEPSVPTSLHQNTMGYGSSGSQAPKSDVKGHPSLDQSYLESMYYIPTGMNASPNSTPSDCYHKPATNMPATGGRRA